MSPFGLQRVSPAMGQILYYNAGFSKLGKVANILNRLHGGTYHKTAVLTSTTATIPNLSQQSLFELVVKVIIACSMTCDWDADQSGSK
jgi:hypothetical protein